jgi:predicted GTPase
MLSTQQRQELSQLISNFRFIDFSKAPKGEKASLIERQLQQLQQLADMPLCAEQVLRLLVAILSLSQKFDTKKIQLHDISSKSDDDATTEFKLDKKTIQALIDAIDPLLQQESNTALWRIVSPAIHAYAKDNNLKNLLRGLKDKVTEHLSPIDITCIMRHAEQATSNREPTDKDLLVLVGATGAGKSTAIHHLAGSTFKNGPDNRPRVNVYAKGVEQMTIGHGATSETTHLSMLAIDNIPAMKQFHSKDLYICDTPGFGDTRGGLGDELKLANALEIVKPLQKAKAVRFLVLLNADTHDARASTLLSTLESVAKLFVDDDALQAACPGITYAITGKNAQSNKKMIVTSIDELLKQQADLGYSDGVKILLEAMQAQFKSNVPLIRPVVRSRLSTRIKPSELMDLLVNQSTPILEPAKVLTPFTEGDCQKSISQQLQIHQGVITRILEQLRQLDTPLSADAAATSDAIDDAAAIGSDEAIHATLSLVALLETKFSELSFMEDCFAGDASYLDACIRALLDTSKALQEQLIGIFCRDDGQLPSEAELEQAKQGLFRLEQLDNLVGKLIAGSFSNNRPRGHQLLEKLKENTPATDSSKAEDTADETLEACMRLEEREWAAYLMKNRPKTFSENVAQQVHESRTVLLEKLKQLVAYQAVKVRQLLATRTQDRQADVLHAIPDADGVAVRLQASDTARADQTKTALQILAQHQDMDRLEETVSEFEAQEEKLRAEICQEGQTIPQVLNFVSTSLKQQEELFGHKMEKMATETIREPFEAMMAELGDQFEWAAPTHDFILLAAIIEHMVAVASKVDLPAETDPLKKALTEQLVQFVEQTTGLLADDDGDQPLAEDATKRLIYHMSILMETKDNAAVKKHIFAPAAVAASSSDQTQLSPAFDALKKAMVERYAALTQAVTNITAARDDMEGLQTLGPALQQLWYLLSIPHVGREKFLRTYTATAQSVREFTLEFCNQFKGQLNRGQQAVEESVYTNIHDYLEYLYAEHWITILGLKDATTADLRQAVTTRADQLTAWADEVDLGIGGAANIPANEWLIIEMGTMNETLANFLDDETRQALDGCLARYNKRLQDALTQIQDQSSQMTANLPKTLPIETLQQYDAYLKACEAEELFATECQQARQAMTAFSKTYTAQQKRAVTQMIGTFAPTTTDMDAADADDTLDSAPLTAILGEYAQLQATLPELYKACDDVDVLNSWGNELSQLTAQYEEALKHALQAATQSQANASKALLAQCEQLKTLDACIKAHADSEPKPLTFNKLHQRYTQAFDREHFDTLSNVMTDVFSGDFEAAARKTTETVPPKSPLRDTLIAQVGVYIATQFDNIKRAKPQLGKSLSAKPTCMKTLMDSLVKLSQADKLVAAGLLSEDQLSTRDQLLRETQAVLDAWLPRVLEQINSSIEELDLKSATQLLNDVTETLASMEIKPADDADALQETNAKLAEKIKTLTEQFDKPLSEWADNEFTLAQVAKAFHDARDLSFDDDSYAIVWETLSTRIFETLAARLAHIEEQFESEQMSVSDVITAIQAIAKIVADMPEEQTKLLANTKDRCRATLTKVQATLVTRADTQKNWIPDVATWVSAKADFDHFVEAFDWTPVAQFVQAKTDSLKEQINPQLQKKLIPTDALKAFGEIYQALNGEFAFLGANLKSYRKQVQALVETISGDMTDALAAYHTSTDKTDALEKFNDALSLLVKLQALAQTDSTAQLLPDDLHAQVAKHLAAVKALLENNNRQFKDALKDRDIPKLQQCLSAAKSFQTTTESIEQYIQLWPTTSLPADLEDLKRLNREYSYVGLLKEACAELAQIKRALTDLSPNQLVGSGATGLSARQGFYQQLKADVTFLEGISALKSHLHTHAEEHALGDDYGLTACMQAVTTFLQSTYRQSVRQFNNEPNIKVDWTNFGCFYQELRTFDTTCSDLQRLAQLEITLDASSRTDDAADADSASSSTVPSIKAVEASKQLAEGFEAYLKQVVQTHKDTYLTDPEPEDKTPALIALLLGMQKMAEELPTLKNRVNEAISDLLQAVLKKRGPRYMNFLGTQLQQDESAYGAKLIREQACFSGMAIAARNMATAAQGIDHVLDNLKVREGDSADIPNISPEMRAHLLDAYKQFEEKYDALIAEYLSDKLDFDNNREALLGNLKAELEKLLATDAVQKTPDGSIIWDQRATDKIPHLCAYLFAIWTLRDSKAYFDPSNVDKSTNFLKKPHAAQVIAIMRLLNMNHTDEAGLPNHFAEVLSGEGKSVVIAVTAAILALLGFSVDAACYSEYLSQRDYADFQSMFEFLGVDAHIQYGTFNRLSEDMLNEKGDLRELVRKAVLYNADPAAAGAGPAATASATAAREKIAISDEADALVTALFGRMYQPYFLLQGPNVNGLIDFIWDRHDKGQSTTFADVKRSPAYQTCIREYPGREFLFDHAVQQMLTDLEQYRQEQGHEYFVNDNGDLYYRFHDGTTVKQSKGYKTLWACLQDKRVSSACTEQHQGLIIPCGAYSYIDLIRDPHRYRAILGATGTLRQLSEPERQIVRDEFKIHRESYLPSAYGANQLTFNENAPGIVEVVEDAHYHAQLITQVKRNLAGSQDSAPSRAVIVFFDTQEALDEFHKSDEFEAFRAEANLMTPASITTRAERDTKINLATRSGQITLAVKEHGRGSDFICDDAQVLQNGGLHVIDAFMPETAAEQIQHQKRTARQGQPGSYSMLMKQSDVSHQFGVTKDRIDEARRRGELYKFITEARDRTFAENYREIMSDLETLRETTHEPSLALLNQVRRPWRSANRRIVIDAMKRTLPKLPILETKKAKVLILVDSTGSMHSVINACKQTLAQAVANLDGFLQDAGFGEDAFEIQIAEYKDYFDGANVLRHSEWSCDRHKLQTFIDGISADGGNHDNGHEAVEVGLYHANTLKGEGLTQVILIGDMRPHRKAEIQRTRDRQHAHFWPSSQHRFAKHYKSEAHDLGHSGIRINAFFLSKASEPTRKSFRKMALITGGQAQEMTSDGEAGVRALQRLFGEHVINDVVEDKKLGANILARYLDSFNT